MTVSNVNSFPVSLENVEKEEFSQILPRNCFEYALNNEEISRFNQILYMSYGMKTNSTPSSFIAFTIPQLLLHLNGELNEKYLLKEIPWLVGDAANYVMSGLQFTSFDICYYLRNPDLKPEEVLDFAHKVVFDFLKKQFNFMNCPEENIPLYLKSLFDIKETRENDILYINLGSITLKFILNENHGSTVGFHIPLSEFYTKIMFRDGKSWVDQQAFEENLKNLKCRKLILKDPHSVQDLPLFLASRMSKGFKIECSDKQEISDVVIEHLIKNYPLDDDQKMNELQENFQSHLKHHYKYYSFGAMCEFLNLLSLMHCGGSKLAIDRKYYTQYFVESWLKHNAIEWKQGAPRLLQPLAALIEDDPSLTKDLLTVAKGLFFLETVRPQARAQAYSFAFCENPETPRPSIKFPCSEESEFFLALDGSPIETSINFFRSWKKLEALFTEKGMGYLETFVEIGKCLGFESAKLTRKKTLISRFITAFYNPPTSTILTLQYKNSPQDSFTTFLEFLQKEMNAYVDPNDIKIAILRSRIDKVMNPLFLTKPELIQPLQTLKKTFSDDVSLEMISALNTLIQEISSVNIITIMSALGELGRIINDSCMRVIQSKKFDAHLQLVKLLMADSNSKIIKKETSEAIVEAFSNNLQPHKDLKLCLECLSYAYRFIPAREKIHKSLSNIFKNRNLSTDILINFVEKEKDIDLALSCLICAFTYLSNGKKCHLVSALLSMIKRLLKNQNYPLFVTAISTYLFEQNLPTIERSRLEKAIAEHNVQDIWLEIFISVTSLNEPELNDLILSNEYAFKKLVKIINSLALNKSNLEYIPRLIHLAQKKKLKNYNQIAKACDTLAKHAIESKNAYLLRMVSEQILILLDHHKLFDALQKTIQKLARSLIEITEFEDELDINVYQNLASKLLLKLPEENNLSTDMLQDFDKLLGSTTLSIDEIENGTRLVHLVQKKKLKNQEQIAKACEILAFEALKSKNGYLLRSVSEQILILLYSHKPSDSLRKIIQQLAESLIAINDDGVEISVYQDLASELLSKLTEEDNIPIYVLQQCDEDSEIENETQLIHLAQKNKLKSDDQIAKACEILAEEALKSKNGYQLRSVSEQILILLDRHNPSDTLRDIIQQLAERLLEMSDNSVGINVYHSLASELLLKLPEDLTEEYYKEFKKLLDTPKKLSIDDLEKTAQQINLTQKRKQKVVLAEVCEALAKVSIESTNGYLLRLAGKQLLNLLDRSHPSEKLDKMIQQLTTKLLNITLEQCEEDVEIEVYHNLASDLLVKLENNVPHKIQKEIAANLISNMHKAIAKHSEILLKKMTFELYLGVIVRLKVADASTLIPLVDYADKEFRLPTPEKDPEKIVVFPYDLGDPPGNVAVFANSLSLENSFGWTNALQKLRKLLLSCSQDRKLIHAEIPKYNTSGPFIEIAHDVWYNIKKEDRERIPKEDLVFIYATFASLLLRDTPSELFIEIAANYIHNAQKQNSSQNRELIPSACDALAKAAIKSKKGFSLRFAGEQLLIMLNNNILPSDSQSNVIYQLATALSNITKEQCEKNFDIAVYQNLGSNLIKKLKAAFPQKQFSPPPSPKIEIVVPAAPGPEIPLLSTSAFKEDPRRKHLRKLIDLLNDPKLSNMAIPEKDNSKDFTKVVVDVWEEIQKEKVIIAKNEMLFIYRNLTILFLENPSLDYLEKACRYLKNEICKEYSIIYLNTIDLSIKLGKETDILDDKKGLILNDHVELLKQICFKNFPNVYPHRDRILDMIYELFQRDLTLSAHDELGKFLLEKVMLLKIQKGTSLPDKTAEKAYKVIEILFTKFFASPDWKDYLLALLKVSPNYFHA